MAHRAPKLGRASVSALVGVVAPTVIQWSIGLIGAMAVIRPGVAQPDRRVIVLLAHIPLRRKPDAQAVIPNPPGGLAESTSPSRPRVPYRLRTHRAVRRAARPGRPSVSAPVGATVLTATPWSIDSIGATVVIRPGVARPNRRAMVLLAHTQLKRRPDAQAVIPSPGGLAGSRLQSSRLTRQLLSLS